MGGSWFRWGAKRLSIGYGDSSCHCCYRCHTGLFSFQDFQQVIDCRSPGSTRLSAARLRYDVWHQHERKSIMNSVTCLRCGASRPPELAEGTARPPCSYCGGTSLAIGLSIVDSLSISDHWSSALIPVSQARDWKQRWTLLQDEIQLI